MASLDSTNADEGAPGIKSNETNETNETNEDEDKVNLLQYLQQRRAAVEKERAAGDGEEKAALQQYVQAALQQEAQSEVEEAQSEVDDQDDEENSTSDNESDEEHDSTDEDPTSSINSTLFGLASSVFETATAATSVVGATPSTATIPSITVKVKEGQSAAFLAKELAKKYELTEELTAQVQRQLAAAIEANEASSERNDEATTSKMRRQLLNDERKCLKLELRSVRASLASTKERRQLLEKRQSSLAAMVREREAQLIDQFVESAAAEANKSRSEARPSLAAWEAAVVAAASAPSDHKEERSATSESERRGEPNHLRRPSTPYLAQLQERTTAQERSQANANVRSALLPRPAQLAGFLSGITVTPVAYGESKGPPSTPYLSALGDTIQRRRKYRIA